jgi:hypothetical protein
MLCQRKNFQFSLKKSTKVCVLKKSTKYVKKKYKLLKKYILILKAADLEKKYKSFKKVRYGNPGLRATCLRVMLFSSL